MKVGRSIIYGLVLCAAIVPAGSLRPARADSEVTPEVDRAIAGGLEFLASQQRSNGSFDSPAPPLAMTGLCMMSFLASGDVPDEGRYGAVVRAAMQHLIDAAPADGYFGRVDGSRMYGQGIVTLALAEAYGADHDPVRRQRARAVLQRAVAVIFKAQDATKVSPFEGGWRYEPNTPDSDLSLSGWNALALRAASNVGIDVPPARVNRAMQFVMRCYRSDQKGFAYQPGRDASIAMTGVGVLNVYLLEGPNRPELALAAAYLAAHPVAAATPMPYYSIYYSTQAAFQAGDPVWSAVWATTRRRLLELRQADGGWGQSSGPTEPGRVYATSMAVLSLSVPYRLLPTYQR